MNKPSSASFLSLFTTTELSHFLQQVRKIWLTSLSDLSEYTLVGDASLTAVTCDIRAVLLIHVNGVGHHELLSVFKGRVTSPVKLEQLAVCVYHVAIGVS